MARSKLTLSVSKTGQPDLGKSILSATLFTVLQGGVPVAQQQPVVRAIGPPGLWQHADVVGYMQAPPALG